MRFQDRRDAGEKLAYRLTGIQPNTLVVGIARGGVLVAREVAKRLQLPLKVLVVKKITSSENPELAIGAVGPDTVYWDTDMVCRVGLTTQDTQFLLTQTQRLQKRRQRLLHGIDDQGNLSGRNIILVDDGIATGATVLAAAFFLRRQHVSSLTLAVPVMAKSTRIHFQSEFDSIIVLEEPEQFMSVGQFYDSFPQVSDDEVRSIL